MTKLIALIIFSSQIYSSELQTGDLLLQPLHCWSCSLIEAQEKSPYSHIGVALKVRQEIFVIEAFGKVRLVPLEEFLKKTQKDELIKVRRLKKKVFTDDEFIRIAKSFLELDYDREFRWNNYNEQGLEKIYCSELVYKIYENFISGLPIKPMKFDINQEYWERYFQGNVPYNELGVSPEDFNQSDLFEDVEID